MLIKFSKKNHPIVVGFILIMLCNSCFQDVIDIDLQNENNKIVIEGAITNQPGPYKITIKRTENIYNADITQIVSGALVIISDDEGNLEILKEREGGIYETESLRGVPERIYTLSVNVDNIVYTAVSKMPKPIYFESIDYTPIQINYNYELSCSFYDHAGIVDYCIINLFRNGYYFEGDQIFYHDKYTDGAEIQINVDQHFYKNENVDIELLTVDKATYNYLLFIRDVLDTDTEETPDIIEMATANPKSNISNGALGYFSAHAYILYKSVVN